ncbi:MAG: phosphopantothenate synthetase [Arenicella sp.]|jgi:phosphopantothenate synthetase
MRSGKVAKARLSSSFSAASHTKPQREYAAETKPFCIRLTDEEKTHLKKQAANESLSTWAREQLLGVKAHKRRVVRQPKVDDKNLAMVLSLFGDQRIASNLNQLARHANMGTLDFDDNILEQIQEACAAMVAIRDYLLSE